MRRDLAACPAQPLAGDVGDRFIAVPADRLIELDQDVTAATAIGGVEVHDGMTSGPGAGEEVEDERVRIRLRDEVDPPGENVNVLRESNTSLAQELHQGLSRQQFALD